MIMNHLMIKHPCLRIVMGFIVVLAVTLGRPALAQDHAPLAHESSSGEHLEELEDIMKKMGKTLKAIRKGSDRADVQKDAVQLQEYVGMAAQHQLRDEEENAYFQEGMAELMKAVDQLVQASANGEELDEAIRQVLSVRKKYHDMLGV